jgi:hypothetical protein
MVHFSKTTYARQELMVGDEPQMPNTVVQFMRSVVKGDVRDARPNDANRRQTRRTDKWADGR